jgi:hypothetical protein
MTALAWQEAPLVRSHDRNTFDCGTDDLNTYLRRYARQNHESGGAKCFVAVERDRPSRILGYGRAVGMHVLAALLASTTRKDCAGSKQGKWNRKTR